MGRIRPHKQLYSAQIRSWIEDVTRANVTSAVRYSRIAALYTAAVAPTLPWLVVLDLRCLWIRPTGNCGENKSGHKCRKTKGSLASRREAAAGWLSNLCDDWLLACVSTATMNELKWTNLQSCSLGARNSLGLGLPGVFTCFAPSLENTWIISLS